MQIAIDIYQDDAGQWRWSATVGDTAINCGRSFYGNKTKALRAALVQIDGIDWN